MTRSDNSLRDVYLRDDYWGYKRPGWKQLLCAWFIVLTVAMLFRITDFPESERSLCTRDRPGTESGCRANRRYRAMGARCAAPAGNDIAEPPQHRVVVARGSVMTRWKL